MAVNIKSIEEEYSFLIGKWKGKGKLQDQPISVEMEVTVFGSNVLRVFLIQNSDNEVIHREEGFFLYDRINDTVKLLLVNSEGTVEINDASLHKRKNKCSIKTNYISGVNLPSNIEIYKALTVEENELHMTIKLGKIKKDYMEVIMKRVE